MLAIASIPGFAADNPFDEEAPPARVTVIITPPYQGPPNRMGLWSLYAMQGSTSLFYGCGECTCRWAKCSRCP
jgi:hypothetical protein